MIPPSDIRRVVQDVAEALDSLGIAYALGGSMASSLHGIARFTADADMTVEPFPGREREFADRFGPDYFVSPDAIRDAIRARGSFNVINTMIGFKVDLFIKKDRPFDDALMGRRIRRASLDPDGPAVDLISPEDVILHKLEWFRAGGEISDRQWSDVLGVLRVQADRLDRDYLDRWAAELGVLDLLEKARGEVAS